MTSPLLQAPTAALTARFLRSNPRPTERRDKWWQARPGAATRTRAAAAAYFATFALTMHLTSGSTKSTAPTHNSTTRSTLPGTTHRTRAPPSRPGLPAPRAGISLKTFASASRLALQPSPPSQRCRPSRAAASACPKPRGAAGESRRRPLQWSCQRASTRRPAAQRRRDGRLRLYGRTREIPRLHGCDRPTTDLHVK